MLKNAQVELEGALSGMLDQINEVILSGGYEGPQIRMYLAGGMAVNYYCGSRYTNDVDASFSRRVLLPQHDLTEEYIKPDGSKAYIYFDKNYNTSFALIHEDFEDDSLEWIAIGNETRKVQLRVFSPLDLAVSKISRFSERDQEDIMELAKRGLFTAEELRARAMSALSYFVGNLNSVRNGIEIICKRIDSQFPTEPPPSSLHTPPGG